MQALADACLAFKKASHACAWVLTPEVDAERQRVNESLQQRLSGRIQRRDDSSEIRYEKSGGGTDLKHPDSSATGGVSEQRQHERGVHVAVRCLCGPRVNLPVYLLHVLRHFRLHREHIQQESSAKSPGRHSLLSNTRAWRASGCHFSAGPHTLRQKQQSSRRRTERCNLRGASGSRGHLRGSEHTARGAQR